jgi:hypothetical protein
MILIRLIVSHLLVDFVLQRKKWVAEKQQRKIRSRYLYIHGLFGGILAYLFAGLWTEWWIGLVVGLSHVVIDIWKTYQKEGLKSFVTDQLLHLSVLILVWRIAVGNDGFGETLSIFFNDPGVWAILAGYMVVIWPAGLLIAYYTRNWKNDIHDMGLYEAGKTIGQLERILILTFVLIGRFEAIGFLIAAKSVFRFNQIQEHKERKVGEYILIGTMLSFAISIAVGLLLIRIVGE